MRHLIARYKSEIIRFILTGGLAAAIHYGIYLLLDLWMNVNLAYTLGYLISFIVNYYLSNYFTFQTRPNVKNGLRFITVHLINYCLQMLLLNLFLWMGVPPSFAPIFVFGIAVPVNFMLVRHALKKA